MNSNFALLIFSFSPLSLLLGGGIFPIPSDLASGIPTIAFTIPDLEAVATLEVTT